MDAHSINFTEHNHAHCIDSAMKTAQEICSKRGVRLTESRAQVLELIWQSHRPLGAYTILEMVSAASSKRIAPPTVYRALEFLLEQGFIHQIKSLNAFLGCPAPHRPHNQKSYFLICKKCGNTMEFNDEIISKKVHKIAKGVGFTVKAESLEIIGLCSACE